MSSAAIVNTYTTVHTYTMAAVIHQWFMLANYPYEITISREAMNICIPIMTLVMSEPCQ